jgi:hypothetical protein
MFMPVPGPARHDDDDDACLREWCKNHSYETGTCVSGQWYMPDAIWWLDQPPGHGRRLVVSGYNGKCTFTVPTQALHYLRSDLPGARALFEEEMASDLLQALE